MSSSRNMASDPEPLFDPEPMVAELRRRSIRAVVVGALVARIRGFAVIETRDLDLVPDLHPGNLQQLAEALHGLGATVRIENHTAGPVRLVRVRLGAREGDAAGA